MSLSRLRLLSSLTCRARRCFSTSNKRLGHAPISYRCPPPPPPKFNQIAGNVIGGFMWWWIFWHLFYDYGHIIGEFEYPDPSKWTNEELGIPPDDYEEADPEEEE